MEHERKFKDYGFLGVTLILDTIHFLFLAIIVIALFKGMITFKELLLSWKAWLIIVGGYILIKGMNLINKKE